MCVGNVHVRGLPRFAALAVLACTATAALAATPFDAFLGSWSGTGQVRYDDGRSESMRCQAFYTGGGQRLNLAIRCNSAGSEVAIRGQLTEAGGSVSGTWEERTFNAAGNVKGQISGNRLTLSVTGGGFTGSMSVSLGGSRQTVAISTQGIPMRSVSVVLAKG
jgi:hypothetical protein